MGLRNKFLAILTITLILIGGDVFAVSSTPTSSLNQKMNELKEIQAQKEKIEKNIEDLNRSQQTLSREIKLINYNINQLNLSIKGNKIVLEQIAENIENFKANIKNIEEEIKTQKENLIKSLIELQEKDRENILVLFLKNKSLAQGVSEAQAIINLNGKIASQIKNLKTDKIKLTEKLADLNEAQKQKATEQKNLINRQFIVNDQKKEKERLLAMTKNQEKIYEIQRQELIKRQEEIAAEIEKIETELRGRINLNLLPQPRPGLLLKPVEGLISQDYGFTDFARYGYRGHFHNGIDIAAPLGTPVVAAESGRVIALGDQDRYCYRGAYGKFIVIKHDNNLVTLYGHLARQIVKLDDKIEKGQVIGYVGQTGYATGPHLHFTVYAGPTFYLGSSRTCGSMPYGGDLNPASYL